MILWLCLGVGSATPRAKKARSGRDEGSIETWLGVLERAEGRAGEKWSVMVRDLENDAIIMEYQPERRLVPASNRKIMAFALGLEKLGPEFRFSTEMGLTAAIDKATGVVKGNAILRSNGDPTMTDRFINQRNPATVLKGWIGEMASMGVKKIDGDFILDASAFGAGQDAYPEVWDVSHRPYSYAAIPSALALNRNLLRVSVRPSEDSGRPGRVKLYPADEGIEIVNETRSVSGSQEGLDVKFTEEGGTVVVSGRIGDEIRDHSLSVPNLRPLAYAKAIVREGLRDAGIKLTGELRIVTDPEAGRKFNIVTPAGRNDSVPLVELLRIMMRDSDNFLAEQIWRAAAFRALGAGDPASARLLERRWYDEHGLSGIEPGFDGSGLSRRDQVSASELVAILKTIFDSPYGPYLVAAMPASGQSGTLRGRDMGAIGRISAKTGTLSGVSALSGFIRDKKKQERWAFSMIANAGEETNGRLTARQNQIINILVGLLDSGYRPKNKVEPARDAEEPPPEGAPRKRYLPGTKELAEQGS